MNNDVEKILLSLYFPRFKSKNCSRFASFFKTLQKDENLLDTKDNFNSMLIYPERIVRNEDKRTSILIKGIPSDIPKKEIRSLIEKYGNLNYLYITRDLKNNEEKSTSVAFVNVINYKTIIPLFMNLRNFKFNNNGQLYDIKIMYSPVQGKNQLKQYVKHKYFCEYFQ